MLRLVLLGTLVLAAVPGCERKATAPAVQPGAAAGKVLELEGEVVAVRDAVRRPLVAGAEVFENDVIETGTDAHVAIVLDHNLARWELGANKHQAINASSAWELPRHAGSAAAGTEATSAAGRHGEKSAAMSAATAGTKDPGAAPASDEGVVERKRVEESAVIVAAGERTAAKPDSLRATEKSTRRPDPKPAKGGMPPPATARPLAVAPAPLAPPAPPPPGRGGTDTKAQDEAKPTLERGGGASTETRSSTSNEISDKQVVPKQVTTIGAADAPSPIAPKPPPSILQREIEKRRPTLTACLVARTSLVVTASARVRTVTFGPVPTPPAVAACLAKLAKQIVLPADSTSAYTFRLTRP